MAGVGDHRQPLGSMQLVPLGDRAVLIRVGDAIDLVTHARVRAVCDAIESVPLAGVTELVPAYAGVAVHYDPLAFAHAGGDPFTHIAAALRARLANLQITAPVVGKRVEVPVRYGGEFGPDLPEVAAHAGLSEGEVIALHTSVEYDVYMIGFAPGFPFLAGLPAEIAMPRRAVPRQAVPAGSVGIGGQQTGIYPIETPGGWRIIGRTDMRLFRPDREPPTLLQLGDRVRFVAVTDG